MLDLAKINSGAILKLESGNTKMAQDMFRENAKKNPCCMTLNNLGVFYSQYGMLLKNNKVRSAKKSGVAYLSKAASYSTNWKNLVSYATALAEYGEISRVYELLIEAYSTNKSILIRYNIGCCLYRMHKYEETASVFRDLCEYVDIESLEINGGINPYLVLAYCEYHLSNKQKCAEYTRLYRQVWEGEHLDVFYLRYLCEMYNEAMSEINELLSEWYLSDALLAMIVDCNQYASTPIESLIVSHERINYLKLLERDPLLRVQKIQEYSFVPPFIPMYQFIQ